MRSMLSSNASAPKRVPRPQNWPGVAEGLAEAERFLQQGDWKAAERLLREVVEFAPREPRAWRLLAAVWRAQGKDADAQMAQARAERLARQAEARGMPVSRRLAELLWRQGEKEAARAMIAVLLLRDPEDEALRRLARDWSGR